jgi:phosphoglycolate phosphatase-like HAD superfamily hydrolase
VCAEPGNDLTSWKEGPTKRAILEFVDRVTTEAGADFVPVVDRIATFDNDGTLWCEQPMYVQGIFAFDRVRHLALGHPEWNEKEPFRAILTNDRGAMGHFGEKEIVEVLAVTHSGMTPEDFTGLARDWLDKAQHPRFHRLFKDCVYPPMIELLDYLRAHQFKTYIVTGGGVEFVRGFAGKTYGIPPEQVIGSSAKTRFELVGDRASLIKLPEIGSIDDSKGKPINIELHIGRRPILAFGNSDGDLEMLQYTASGSGRRLMLLLHHDDAEREYAYDRESKVGRLDKALEEAVRRGWVVVSMKRDFTKVFAFEP